MSTPSTVARAVRNLRDGAATLPFFGYLTLFLFLPTVFVVLGAFRTREGAFTLEPMGRLLQPATLQIFLTTAWLSAASALIGAAVGGAAAYALSTTSPTGLTRRVFTAVCSVLAQFGGVMLAFSFIAVLGKFGNLTRLLADVFGIDLDDADAQSLVSAETARAAKNPQ